MQVHFAMQEGMMLTPLAVVPMNNWFTIDSRVVRIWMRRFGIGVSLLVAIALSYLLLLCFPEPLFCAEAQRHHIYVYSDQPLPPAINVLLKEVERRLAASPLYRAEQIHRVFLCQSPRRFAFFTNVNAGAGGVTYVYFNRSIFLRPARIAANRLLAPSGQEVPGNRTLVYFITHELTHDLTISHLGARAYSRLPEWVREGYADYVAQGDTFNFRLAREQFLRGAPAMDPARSGLYLRYHLLVAYLLDIKGISVDALLTQPFNVRQLETEIRHLTLPPERGGWQRNAGEAV